MSQLKINMRRGVFETNSSSQHTFCLSAKEKIKSEEIDIEAIKAEMKEKLSIDPEKPFYLRAERETYGQEYSIYTTWSEKLQYMLAAFRVENIRILVSAIQVGFPEFQGFEVVMGEDAFKSEITNSWLRPDSLPIYERDELYSFLGDVDHQSSGYAEGFVSALKKEIFKGKSSEEIIFYIIFSPSFAIITGSDGGSPLESFYEEGMLASMGFENCLHVDFDYDKKRGGYFENFSITSIEKEVHRYDIEDEDEGDREL